MSNVSRALRLAAQTLEIQYHSPPGDAKLTLVTSKMSSLFSAVKNKLSKKLFSINRKGDEIQFRIFYTCPFNLNMSIKQVKKRILRRALLYLTNMYIKLS